MPYHHRMRTAHVVAFVAVASVFAGCTGILGTFEVGQTDAGPGRTDATADVTADTFRDDRTTPPPDVQADVPRDVTPDGIVCDGGVAGRICNGLCTPLTDIANCGTCGNRCGTTNAAPTCTNDRCVFNCTAGFAHCGNNDSTGCQINTRNDPNNCGSCGNVCRSGRCTNGSCGPLCADIVTNSPMWGTPAMGVDLRKYTGGSLDWLGCPGDGCQPNEFFCNDEATGIFFGSNLNVLRAVVDPGNAGGDPFPSTSAGCCSSAVPRGKCNGPRRDNDGVGGINSGDALCKAMGFASGNVVDEFPGNGCPRPNTTVAAGTSGWTSTFDGNTGGSNTSGRTFRCLR
jgi:hypothetical protein